MGTVGLSEHISLLVSFHQPLTPASLSRTRSNDATALAPAGPPRLTSSNAEQSVKASRTATLRSVVSQSQAVRIATAIARSVFLGSVPTKLICVEVSTR